MVSSDLLPVACWQERLALLQLVEAGNAESLARKAPRAGFHHSLATRLAGDTVHDAGVAGDLPLRFFQFEKFSQGA